MDTICIQKGQWLPLRFTFWADTDKSTAVDLTGGEISVVEANPSELTLLAPNVSDPQNGIVELTIDEDQSNALNEGRVNWFKLEVQFDSANILTPKIWIKADD